VPETEDRTGVLMSWDPPGSTEKAVKREA
ncbi:hypothetical protein RRG08_007006, partial [Elysia crispata]